MTNLIKSEPLTTPVSADSQNQDIQNQEIDLLESAAICGRKTELRQLLKLLAMAKAGQPKAVLVLGDTGIGKTALLEAFGGIVRRGMYSRILDISDRLLRSPADLYLALIESLQNEANAVLDEALIAANDVNRELGMTWERQDLLRAVSLVKLQESISGIGTMTPGSAQHEKLAKALRNSVPTSKKLKLPVNDQIDKLVSLVINPWVNIAAVIANPTMAASGNTALQEALEVAQHLKQNTPLPATKTEKALSGDTQEEAPVIDLPGGNNPSKTTSALSRQYQQNALGNNSQEELQEEPEEGETPVTESTEKLLRHLTQVFRFVNNTLENIDSALLIVIDQWEQVLTLPEQQRDDLKTMLAELLKSSTDGINQHMMVVVGSRSEGESYSLGGSLYNYFRTKLLLPGLSEKEAFRMIRFSLKQEGLDLDEAVHHQMFRLTRGNPFWHHKLLSYVKERAEANKVERIDFMFYRKLGIESLDDICELSFTRVKLAFLNDEESLYKILATIFKQYGTQPFLAMQAIKEISVSQGFADNLVFEVLKRLEQHNFLIAMRGKARQDLRYKIQSIHAYDFLKEKTRSIETDISTDEKLHYLKKIIPLSVKSGELDRNKTQEVIALSHTLGNQDMIGFLEETFIEYLHDERPVVRVTSLNNLALIDSERSREAVFEAIADDNAMVREYATRNMASLAQKTVDPLFHRRVVETLTDCVDDDYEIVREQVYETLSRYRWNHDLTNIFVKGMSDASETVRLHCIKNLADMPSENPFVKNALMDATDDKNPEVRKQACVGIQHYPGEETIRLLVQRLRNDADTGIRALAADSLSRMEEDSALGALVDALYKEQSEDVKLAVIRAMGKRKSWKNEEVLVTLVEEAIESLNTSKPCPPAVLWATVRSLGNTGGTERSKSALSDLKAATTNEIIVNAAEFAIRKIDDRISDLRHLERELQEATPTTTAVPSEYNDEVAVLEDDAIIIESRSDS